jgi:hypothetical protein|tara:strand:- start:358 stop:870 length:513 start_codon:yes stop_codon:yes gene_type:complete
MTKPNNSFFNDTLVRKLKNLRIYEQETYCKWGHRKRIFKMVGVNFEIKFCRAEMLLSKSLQDQECNVEKKIKMIEMMNRAFEQLNIKCEESGYAMLQPDTKCFCLDKKIIVVCDTDEQKPLLNKIHKQEKDIMIFSIEELLRCIPNDFMEAKKLLSSIDKRVNFKRIDYV